MGEGGELAYGEGRNDVHSPWIPDVILAILGAGDEEGSCVVPLHFLKLSALKLEGYDLSLGKHIPNAAGPITTRSLHIECGTSILWQEFQRLWDCTPCSGSSDDAHLKKARVPHYLLQCLQVEPSIASRYSVHMSLHASHHPPLQSSKGTSRRDQKRRMKLRT